MCIYCSFSLGFSALFQEKIAKALWIQEYSWWTGHALLSTAWAPTFPRPHTQKWKARPFLAFSVHTDKEGGTGRRYIQNDEQAGFANRAGKRAEKVSLFSGQEDRDQITEEVQYLDVGLFHLALQYLAFTLFQI